MDDLVLDAALQQDADNDKIDDSAPLMGTPTIADHRRPAVSPQAARDGSDVSGRGGGKSAAGELELPHRHSEAELEFSLRNKFGMMDELAKIDEKDLGCMGDHEDGNFEDEFDPILASIRKPPQPSPTASFASSSTVGGGVKKFSSPGGGGISKEEDRGKRPNADVSFAAGVLSIFPGDVRARAEDVMAQSSANVSKTAGAFRAALAFGVDGASGKGRKRDYGAGIEIEDGRGEGDLVNSSYVRRVVAGGEGGGKGSGLGGEDDVRVMDVNELLSEEEVRVFPARLFVVCVPGDCCQFFQAPLLSGYVSPVLVVLEICSFEHEIDARAYYVRTCRGSRGSWVETEF